MSAVSPLRKVLRAFAHQLLARLAEGAVDGGQEVELIVAPPWEVTIEAHTLDAVQRVAVNKQRAIKIGMDALRAEAGREVQLTSMEQAILDVLDAETPRKIDWIAHKLRREPDSYLWKCIANLVRVGKLKRVGHGRGYVLAPE